MKTNVKLCFTKLDIFLDEAQVRYPTQACILVHQSISDAIMYCYSIDSRVFWVQIRLNLG